MPDGDAEVLADGWTEYGAAHRDEENQRVRTLTTESLAVLMPFKVQEIIIIPAMIEIDDVVSDSFRINLLTYRFRPQLAHLQRFQDNCLALAGFQNLHPPFLPEHMRRHYLSPRQEGRPART